MQGQDGETQFMGETTLDVFRGHTEFTEVATPSLQHDYSVSRYFSSLRDNFSKKKNETGKWGTIQLPCIGIQ